jgi:type I restriction enzyme M protein
MSIRSQSTEEEMIDVADSVAEPSADYGELDTDSDAGGIFDLITEEPIRLNEVESIRQEEERKLLEEFGYEEADYRDLIRVNVRVKPQQLKARKFPLVVLRPLAEGEVADQNERLSILIDIVGKKTKPEDANKGAEALRSYLKDTPKAQYAVWTNGTERVVFWKTTGRIKVDALVINDIPRYGRDVNDSFAPGRRKLRKAVAGSLRQAFQRCHDYIWANQGGSNETIFWEFLKIVFAKIEDERRLLDAPEDSEEGRGLFAIASLEERNDPERAEAVKKRLQRLYVAVRNRYPELFRLQTDQIDLQPRIITYIVAQLAHYDFLNSSVDVKGEAYEAIVGKNLEGTRGEFFTPRNAVKMGVRILDPKPGDKCLDPACGTGGFIVVILNYIAEQIRREANAENLPGAVLEDEYRRRLRLASQRIFGLDINSNLVRVARMNMVMNNDGQGGITHLNSLDTNPDHWHLPAGTMRRWESNGSQREVPVSEFFRDELREGTFDIIATNPPFGTKIKIDDEDILEAYELGHRWSWDQERGIWFQTPARQAGVPPEVLFIERVVRLLKPGTGKACIVVPNGILGNPDDEYIRAWLMRNCEVLALVSMPVELFLPKVGIDRKSTRLNSSH